MKVNTESEHQKRRVFCFLFFPAVVPPNTKTGISQERSGCSRKARFFERQFIRREGNTAREFLVQETDPATDRLLDLSLKQTQVATDFCFSRYTGPSIMSRLFIGRGFGMGAHDSNEWKKWCSKVSLSLFLYKHTQTRTHRSSKIAIMRWCASRMHACRHLTFHDPTFCVSCSLMTTRQDPQLLHLYFLSTFLHYSAHRLDDICMNEQEERYRLLREMKEEQKDDNGNRGNLNVYQIFVV